MHQILLLLQNEMRKIQLIFKMNIILIYKSMSISKMNRKIVYKFSANAKIHHNKVWQCYEIEYKYNACNVIPQDMSFKNKKEIILVGNMHRILLLGKYRDGKYSWNCFLSKTKDDEWSRGKYFRNYIFFYIWCVSNAW